MEATIRRCERCRFYFASRGECRRYPPVVAILYPDDPRLAVHVAYPGVAPEDWCGEFAALPAKVVIRPAPAR